MDTKKPAHRAALSKEDYHKLTGFDGDWRDTWWNDDFLSMMARRWRLEQVQTVLDVGCRRLTPESGGSDVAWRAD